MPERIFGAGERLLYGPGWLGAVLQRWEAANAWWSDHVVKFDYTEPARPAGAPRHPHPGRTRYLGWAFCGRCSGGSPSSAWHLGRGGAAPRPDALARAYLAAVPQARARRRPARAAAPGPARTTRRAWPAQRPELRRAACEALLRALRAAALRAPPWRREARGGRLRAARWRAWRCPRALPLQPDLKPMRACVPSQNGLVALPPQRHSVAELTRATTRPVPLMISRLPRTLSGPSGCGSMRERPVAHRQHVGLVRSAARRWR